MAGGARWRRGAAAAARCNCHRADAPLSPAYHDKAHEKDHNHHDDAADNADGDVDLLIASLKLNQILAQLQEVLLQSSVACKGVVVGKIPVLEVFEQQEGVDAGGGRQRGRGGRGRLLVDVHRHQVADWAPVVPVVEGYDGVVEQLVGPRHAGVARLVCPVVRWLGKRVTVHQDALRPKVRLA